VVNVAIGAEAERLGLRYLTLAYRVRKVVDKYMIAGGLSLARWKLLRRYGFHEHSPESRTSIRLQH
jgi:hypothetical protein